MPDSPVTQQHLQDAVDRLERGFNRGFDMLRADTKETTATILATQHDHEKRIDALESQNDTEKGERSVESRHRKALWVAIVPLWAAVAGWFWERVTTGRLPHQ